MMNQAQGQHRDLIQSIEGLPAAPGLSPLDQDLLMLKATSMATMNCLNECLHILHLQQVARQRGSLGGESTYIRRVDSLALALLFCATVELFCIIDEGGTVALLTTCVAGNAIPGG